MSVVQRRIILKPTSPTSLISIVILLASTVLIEIYFTDYLKVRGLEFKSYQFAALPAIPYLYLPIIGFVAVMLSSWMYLARARLVVQAKPGVQLNSTILPARTFEATFVLMTIQVAALFVPYVLGSNWMLNELSSVTTIILGLRVLYLWFYGTIAPMMGLDPIWKYFASNAVSYTIIVAATLIMGRKPKRQIAKR